MPGFTRFSRYCFHFQSTCVPHTSMPSVREVSLDSALNSSRTWDPKRSRVTTGTTNARGITYGDLDPGFGIGTGIGGKKVRNRLGCAVGRWSFGTEHLWDLVGQKPQATVALHSLGGKPIAFSCNPINAYYCKSQCYFGF